MLNITLVARWFQSWENVWRLILPSRACFGRSMISRHRFTTEETRDVIGISEKCQDAKRAGWHTMSLAAFPVFLSHRGSKQIPLTVKDGRHILDMPVPMYNIQHASHRPKVRTDATS